MLKRDLHRLLIGFKAESLANGTILVRPHYRNSMGVLGRMALAQHVTKVLNANYRQRRKRRAGQLGEKL